MLPSAFKVWRYNVRQLRRGCKQCVGETLTLGVPYCNWVAYGTDWCKRILFVQKFYAVELDRTKTSVRFKMTPEHRTFLYSCIDVGFYCLASHFFSLLFRPSHHHMCSRNVRIETCTIQYSKHYVVKFWCHQAIPVIRRHGNVYMGWQKLRRSCQNKLFLGCRQRSFKQWPNKWINGFQYNSSLFLRGT